MIRAHAPLVALVNLGCFPFRLRPDRRVFLSQSTADRGGIPEGEHPNVDFAIAAMADACHLPPTAPFTIFAMVRSVGWTAHILKQTAMGSLIRPRAQYMGPPLPACPQLPHHVEKRCRLEPGSDFYSLTLEG